ncbi:MAG: nucleotidyltransferase family protein, partial [Thermoflexales bacterium]|nr:nucleotidyltransferase family protein [Thermoflexales bacterium]
TPGAPQRVTPTFAVLVLAAGMSTRFGQNKLLMPFGEVPVVRRAVLAALQSAVGEVFVVTGYQREAVVAVLNDLPVTFLHNPDYATGEMLSSIQTGLRALDPTPAQAAFVALGDQPLVPAWVFRRLAQAYAQRCGSILAPMFAGQRGHPVLLGRRWWAPALSLPRATPLRTLLQAHPADIATLLVGTDAVLRDVDTPEAYAEALRLLNAGSGALRTA